MAESSDLEKARDTAYRLLSYRARSVMEVEKKLKEKGFDVKFSSLTNFVSREAKKSTDPVYGREALNKGDPTNKKATQKPGPLKDKERKTAVLESLECA